MPQAKRSTSSTRSRSSFKQPPALKRLSSSLDTAQKSLQELRRGAGRDVGSGAQDLYTDLRAFVRNARRDSNKLARALQRDFERAQKQLTKASTSTRSRGGTSQRSGTKRTAAKRTTSKRSTTRRTSAKR